MYNIIENIDFDYLNVIESKIKSKVSISERELFYFLECVVYIVRNKIYDDEHPNFESKCDLAQSIICYYFNSIGINNYPCLTNNTIYSNCVGHSFIVGTFNVEDREINCLIDPTYIQFFKKENCNDSKYVVINHFIVFTPDPGFFIKEEDCNRIKSFNYYGFGILDEELARIYGNSFYNTRTMKTNKNFEELSGEYYINSFLKNGKENLSIDYNVLVLNNYIIDFNNVNRKK